MKEAHMVKVVRRHARYAISTLTAAVFTTV